MRTSFHHQSEAQHPKSSAIHKYAGRLPHLWVINGQVRAGPSGLFCVRRLPATVVNFHFSAVSNLKSAVMAKTELKIDAANLALRAAAIVGVIRADRVCSPHDRPIQATSDSWSASISASALLDFAVRLSELIDRI